MSKLPPALNRLTLPVIASPMFIISTAKFVIAQCRAGIVGSMPALNVRPAGLLDDWLAEITESLDAHNRAHPDSSAAFIVGDRSSGMEERARLLRRRRVDDADASAIGP